MIGGVFEGKNAEQNDKIVINFQFFFKFLLFLNNNE
jgi:hypothetical protein